jgi:hypothetical protein
VKSFALSQLTAQRALLGDRFLRRYPHYWLVWEPGPFVVPRNNTSTIETAVPRWGTTLANPAPRSNDPLCFVLVPTPNGASLGRAEGNDLVLSDETVSRRHCLFEHEDNGWSVRCFADSKAGLLVQGQPIAPGNTKEVTSGNRIELGHVTITVLSPWSLVQRIDAAATAPNQLP